MSTSDPPVRAAIPPRPPIVPGERVLRMIEAGFRNKKNRKLLIYVHIPFCSSKCHFCDWVVGYSVADLTDEGALRDQYVDALCKQLRFYGPRLTQMGYEPGIVYWGGGTPTRLSVDQIRRIQKALGESFDLSRVTEYTVECSPETLTSDKIAALRDGGLNRLSIGVQSFDDGILRRMGRSHDARLAESAIDLARRGGVDNINLDFIAGFPEQSPGTVVASLERAVDLGIGHLSVYLFREFASALVSLQQVQRGTREKLPRAERRASYFAAKEWLEEQGYREYMISYFARDEKVHFQGEDHYFGLLGDYMGFGAGVYSTMGHCVLKRSANPARYSGIDVRGFVADPTGIELVAPARAVSPGTWLGNYIPKALSTKHGVQYDRWREQLGFDFREWRKLPVVEAWFAEQRREGAEFVEGDERVTLTPATWTETLVRLMMADHGEQTPPRQPPAQPAATAGGAPTK